MKAIIEYNLPEEQYEFDCANNATLLKAATENLIEQTRSWLKWGHDFKTADEAIEAFQTFLMEELERE